MTAEESRGEVWMERDPDIAALAARLGLQQFGYRTFARPVLARPAPESPAAVLPRAPEAPAAIPFPGAPPAIVPVQPTPGRVTAALPEAAVTTTSDDRPHFPLLAQVFQGGAVAIAPASAQPFLALRRAVAGRTDSAEH